MKALKIIGAVIVGLMVIGWLAGPQHVTTTTAKSRTVEDKVFREAAEEYNMIARNNASAMDRCVKAGLVVAAVERTLDEASYRTWRTRRDKDCEAAGL